MNAVGRQRGNARQRAGLAGLLAAALLLGNGCEEEPFLGSTAGYDFGDNNPGLYAAMGDSITQGYGDCGAPYPNRLSALLGRSVINFGVGGARAADGLAQVNGVLAQNPGFVIVYYGANDAIHGADAGSVKEVLRAIVARVQETQAIAILANLTPMTGSHGIFDGNRRAISNAIGDLASEDGVPLVDLAGAFGSGAGLLQSDGLHPNDAGNQVIAETFYDSLRFTVQ